MAGDGAAEARLLDRLAFLLDRDQEGSQPLSGIGSFRTRSSLPTPSALALNWPSAIRAPLPLLIHGLVLLPAELRQPGRGQADLALLGDQLGHPVAFGGPKFEMAFW